MTWKPIDVRDAFLACSRIPRHIALIPHAACARLPLVDRPQYTVDRPELDGLYKKYGGLERDVIMIPFRGIDRLKLMHSILVAKRADMGCNLDMLRLVKSKCLLAFFPLHDKIELRALQRK